MQQNMSLGASFIARQLGRPRSPANRDSYLYPNLDPPPPPPPPQKLLIKREEKT